MVNGESLDIQRLGLAVISVFIIGLGHVAVQIADTLYFISLSRINLDGLIVLAEPD